MPRPLAVQRHHEILSRVGAARSVSVDELAAHFDVSHETIRRDLKLLATQGHLQIVHGGALRRESAEPPYAQRRLENEAGKAAIAELAVARIEEGMVVLLDSGTTTLALAHALARAQRRGLLVCTASLAHAQILVRAGCRVTLLGGDVDPDEEAAFGIDVVAALERFRVDCAFVGAGGLSPDGVVTDFSRMAVTQRVAMLKAARRGFLLADHRKFGRVGPVVLPLDGIAPVMIVDRAPPPESGKALSQRGVEIQIAPSP